VPAETIGAATRIVVRSRISLASLLPSRQKDVIKKIAGVQAISPFSWFGGRFQSEDHMSFAQFALDPAQVTTIFTEATVAPDQIAAFKTNRTACIVGKITAERYGLKIGDHFTLTSTVYPCSLEFKVAGFYSGTIDDRNMFFHHQYLDDSSGMDGWVGTWWVKARTIEDMPRVIEAINKAFANSSAEVRAETERAFQLNFVSMWGNIKILVHSLCSVVVFTLLVVSASTMSMAVRERFRELAVLKALGFRRRELFGFILAESFGLAALGGLVGIGGAWALYTFGSIARMTAGVFVSFEVTPRIMGQAAVVAAVLGILASIAPAISVARMSVVAGLKTLD
jgi:putative ABC transport system permease protein